MDEQFKVVQSFRCETLEDIYEAGLTIRIKDPRGSSVSKATAVHIDNKVIQIDVREFPDGTREYSFSGV